jgi:Ca-activated chloride channel family protein
MRDRYLFASIAVVLGLLVAGHFAHARPSVDVDVRLGNPVLPANHRGTVYLKVGLFGRQAGASARRPAVNICLAIDRSGSMAGEKLAQARAGAVAALRRLSPEDTVSVVAYDDTVDVLVPASSAGERSAIEQGIAALEPGGSTALYAGVVKCAAEVRRRLDLDRVNRIILLSDGQANVGPSSPAALGALGADLMREGISVSTVGLGLDYNEDLMTELALRSDGRHTFVERAGDLTAFLDEELSSVTSVVARDVDVHVRCRGGARPLRVLGRPATIVGETVSAAFGKVYGGREHFLLVELEVPGSVGAGGAGGEHPLADVDVSYRDLLAGRSETRTASASARFSTRSADVSDHIDRQVMGVVELTMADLASERALALRDQGQLEAARSVLNENARRLQNKAAELKDDRLLKTLDRQMNDAKNMPASSQQWQQQRKVMKKTINDNPLEGL